MGTRCVVFILGLFHRNRGVHRLPGCEKATERCSLRLSGVASSASLAAMCAAIWTLGVTAPTSFRRRRWGAYEPRRAATRAPERTRQPVAHQPAPPRPRVGRDRASDDEVCRDLLTCFPPIFVSGRSFSVACAASRGAPGGEGATSVTRRALVDGVQAGLSVCGRRSVLALEGARSEESAHRPVGLDARRRALNVRGCVASVETCHPPRPRRCRHEPGPAPSCPRWRCSDARRRATWASSTRASWFAGAEPLGGSAVQAEP